MSDIKPITMRQEMDDDGTVRVFVVGDFPDRTMIESSFLDRIKGLPFAVVDGDELKLTFENGGAVYRIDAEDDDYGYRIAHLQRGELWPTGAA